MTDSWWIQILNERFYPGMKEIEDEYEETRANWHRESKCPHCREPK